MEHPMKNDKANREVKRPLVQALGLSLEYYRASIPGYIPRLEDQFQRFLAEIKPHADFSGANLCCVQREVEDAVKQAEQNGADALLLMPLSYTASLMTFRPIRQSSLPVIIWNTQEARTITPDYNDDDLLMNHVTQGTQDITNVLTRNGRTFGMESGHYRDQAALAKLAEWLNAAKAVQFAKKHDLILIHDFAYAELYFEGKKPVSCLSIPGAKDVCIEFHSLSRSLNEKFCVILAISSAFRWSTVPGFRLWAFWMKVSQRMGPVSPRRRRRASSGER